MKKIIGLLTLTVLLFAFGAQAQTIKRATFNGTVSVASLTSQEIDDLTDEANYGTLTVVTGATSLPSSDANCTGSVNVCSLYIKFPASGCTTITFQQILTAIKAYINNHSNAFPGCGTQFSVTIPNTTCTYDVVFFCKA